MLTRYSPRRIPVYVIILILSSLQQTHAQPVWQTCKSCYRNFTYDSSFGLGVIPLASTPAGIDTLRDRLGFSFALTYGKQSPFVWDTSGVDSMYTRTILRAHGLNFGVGYPILNVVNLAGDSRRLESYWMRSDTVQTSYLAERSSPVIDTVSMLSYGLLYAGTAPDSTTPTDMKIAGNPVYTASNVFLRTNPSNYLWLDTTYPSLDLGDRSLMFRVGVALQITPDSVFNGLPVGRKLGYAVLYYRNRSRQTNGIKCHIYSPFDTLEITKRRYTDSSDDAGGGFKEVSWLVDMVTGTLELNPGQHPGDTLATVFQERQIIGSDTDDIYFVTRVPMNGGWFGWADDDDTTTCDGWFNTGQFPAGSVNEIVEDSDFIVKIWTTREVPVTLLRTSVSQHLYDLLRDTLLNPMIRTSLDALIDIPELNQTYRWFGLYDEPPLGLNRANAIISSRIQDLKYARNHNDTRTTYTNLFANYDGYRLLTGDFDTTRVKIVQQMNNDHYFIFRYPLPAFYGNPDSMSVYSNDEMYSLTTRDISGGGGVTRGRLIAGNSIPDYQWYTSVIQEATGKYRDYKTNTGPGQTTSSSPMLSNLARSVDVAKFKYQHLGPPGAIWSYIDIHGWLNGGAKPGAAGQHATAKFEKRPPTPEETSLHAWVVLGSGVDRAIFSNVFYDHTSWGIMKKDYSHANDYEQLVNPNFPTVAEWTLPRTWSGLRTRYDSVKSLITAIKDIDTRVGWANLTFSPSERISLHDTAQTFSAMPMLDTVYLRRASRYQKISGAYVDSLDSAGTAPFDPRTESYLEITHFRPESGDIFGTATHARYALFVNRRTWPSVTGIVYSDTTRRRFDTIAPQDSGSSLTRNSRYGLGYIDLRKPVVRLKNSTPVLADQLIIEKVRDTSWKRTITAGDSVSLDWLEPGAGELYRVRPVPLGVSKLGTAYNNGVHSENPSTNFSTRDRIITYQRDSVIYLRTIDASGNQSSEWMISDPFDTTVVGGQRFGFCLNPVVATARNMNSCLVVWERIDTVNKLRSVEGAYVATRPTKAGGLPTINRWSSIYGPVWLTDTTFQFTPALVNTGRIYAIAWANPTSGIDVVSGADSTVMTLSTITNDVATPPEIGFTLNTKARYPTLAFVNVLKDSGYVPIHLAYQQGDPATSATHIMYNNMRINTVTRAVVANTTENVSQRIYACGFRHPSIAADSARIGVAFDVIHGDRSVALRLRDTGNFVSQPGSGWRTPLYRWGGYYPLWDLRKVAFKTYSYERASLTEFPRLGGTSLRNKPEGGLAWQWTNAPSNRKNGQWIYRYGETAPQPLHDGQHPSMMLVPNRSSDPFASSSVFYRGTDSVRFTKGRVNGGTGYYYPGALDNSPAAPVGWFARSNPGKGIVSGYRLSDVAFPYENTLCGIRPPKLDHALVLAAQTAVDVSNASPALPPSFFAAPDSSSNIIDNLGKTWSIARTSVFAATPDTIQIRRIASGSDSLVAWMNRSPYDSVANMAADITMYMELVRAIDSTVLWRGDSISARQLADTTWDDLVDVPIAPYIASGLGIFIRLRATPTTGLDVNTSAEFTFVEDSIGGGVPKEVVPDENIQADAMPGPASTMELRVLPNPVRTSAEIQLYLAEQGTADLTVYDMSGRSVLQLSALEASLPGWYSLEIETAELEAGSYLVRAVSGSSQQTAKFTVVR